MPEPVQIRRSKRPNDPCHRDAQIGDVRREVPEIETVWLCILHFHHFADIRMLEAFRRFLEALLFEQEHDEDPSRGRGERGPDAHRQPTDGEHPIIIQVPSEQQREPDRQQTANHHRQKIAAENAQFIAQVDRQQIPDALTRQQQSGTKVSEYNRQKKPNSISMVNMRITRKHEMCLIGCIPF